MIRLLIAALLAFVPVAAAAQQPAQSSDQPQASPHWAREGTMIESVPARTAFPVAAGPISLVRTQDFSNPETGLDSALQYRSADNEVLGTVYVYLPGLPHPGLAAYATEQGMRLNSGSPLRLTRNALVRAGGIDNAAIRADYENYRGGYSTSAAFIHAGRWMIKVRVSAPDGRRREVDAAMDALLKGIKFGAKNPVQAATMISVTDCPSGETQKDAGLLPDPMGADAMSHGMLLTFDGAGIIAKHQNGGREDLPSRVPAEMCLSSRVSQGKGEVPILRSADGPAVPLSGRTRLVALISDSGTWVEVVHSPALSRFLMIYHQIGASYLLGGYDAVPSDRQIADLLNNPKSDAGRIRVPVRLKADGGTEIQVSTEPEKPAPTT